MQRVISGSGRGNPIAMIVMIMGLLIGLSACGGDGVVDDGSMACATFLDASPDQQLEAIALSANEIGFDQETFGGEERTREGVVRACAARTEQRVGGVIGGFVSGLSD